MDLESLSQVEEKNISSFEPICAIKDFEHFCMTTSTGWPNKCLFDNGLIAYSTRIYSVLQTVEHLGTRFIEKISRKCASGKKETC